MPIVRRVLLCVLVLGTTGCFKAVINTGRTPNGQTIERPWAHSFIAGLVPPSVTEAASACPNGVARVETQHSILNVLAHAITFGIYTPMTIIVSCAGGDAPEDGARIQAGDAGAAEALNAAARQTAETREPVWVELR